jgi:hypothetical protein
MSPSTRFNRHHHIHIHIDRWLHRMEQTMHSLASQQIAQLEIHVEQAFYLSRLFLAKRLFTPSRPNISCSAADPALRAACLVYCTNHLGSFRRGTAPRTGNGPSTPPCFFPYLKNMNGRLIYVSLRPLSLIRSRSMTARLSYHHPSTYSAAFAPSSPFFPLRSTILSTIPNSLASSAGI